MENRTPAYFTECFYLFFGNYLVCQKYDEAIQNNHAPHLVLDLTKYGNASQNLKFVTLALALPTISASFGQMGDLLHWNRLTKAESQYLLQVYGLKEHLNKIDIDRCTL